MNFYEDEKKLEKDKYYEDESRKAIEAAVEFSRGKSPEEVRRIIRKSYCFGPLRAGRPYKIWRRLMLEKEAELGLEPKHHKQ